MAREFNRSILVVALAIGGAFVGLAFSLVRPPIYESSIIFEVVVEPAEYVQLSEVMRKRALDKAAGIVQSDRTLASVLDRIPETLRLEYGWDAPADLRPWVRLDVRHRLWRFVGRNPDPAVAVEIANAWASAAVAELADATEGARDLRALIGSPIAVSCDQIQILDQASSDVSTICWVEAVGMDPDDLIGELRTSADRSRGLLPFTSYALDRTAESEPSAATRNRTSVVGAGAVIGLLVGLLLTALSTKNPRGDCG